MGMVFFLQDMQIKTGNAYSEFKSSGINLFATPRAIRQISFSEEGGSNFEN